MPVTITCPHCDKQLRLPDNLMGQTVRCPGCKETFTAEEPPAAGVSASRREAPPPPPPEEERPSRRVRRDDDEADDRPSRRGRRDDADDDAEDRPRRSRRFKEQHRGAMILTFGILAFVVLPFVFGPMAWIMGNNDLAEMDSGRMDPEGRSMTNIGRILGMVSTGLFVLWLVAVGGCICLGFAGALTGGGR